MSEFSTRKLLKNHLSKTKNHFKISGNFIKLFAIPNKLLLSAQLQTFELSRNRKILLMKILKRRGSKIVSWGTPVFISCQLLKSFLILHLENLFVKYLWTKLNKLLSKPCASKFANNREWYKVLNAFKLSLKIAPTLSFWFKIVFHYSIISSRVFWVLWLLWKPVNLRIYFSCNH